MLTHPTLLVAAFLASLLSSKCAVLSKVFAKIGLLSTGISGACGKGILTALKFHSHS